MTTRAIESLKAQMILALEAEAGQGGKYVLLAPLPPLLPPVPAKIAALVTLPGTKSYPRRYALESGSGKTYTISQKPTGEWGCSCPAHIYRRAPKGPCKHLRALGVEG